MTDTLTLDVFQRTVLAYVRTAVGGTSVLCSSLIVRLVLCLHHHDGGNGDALAGTYQRMLLGISCLDILTSFWMALSTLVVPAETGVIGGHGTTVTCTFQGFFVQLSVSIPVYMMMLSFYFMLKIRYNVPNDMIRAVYEPWFHGVPIAIGVITSVVGVGLDLFNPIVLPEMGCWIAGWPSYCPYVDEIPCERGYRIKELLDWYVWLFSYMWLMMSFAAILVCHVLIYSFIRQCERRNARYASFAGMRNPKPSTSRNGLDSPAHATIDEQLPARLASDPVHEQPGLPQDVEPVNYCADEKTAKDAQTGRSVHIQNDSASQSASSARSPLASSSPKIAHGGYGVQSETKTNATNDKVMTELNEADVSCLECTNRSTTDKSWRRRSYRQSTTGTTEMDIAAQKQSIRISRRVAFQSTLYVVFAFFTFIWTFMPWFGVRIGVGARVRFFFSFMTNIVVPSNGIFNLFIYVRPRYVKLRQLNQDWTRWQTLCRCMFRVESDGQFSPEQTPPSLSKM